jgi:hypothetical protein
MLVNALTVLVGIAADLGADVYLNGMQIDNQSSIGSDDGGCQYWNRVLQVPISSLIIVNNVIAAVLDNAAQPSDGTSFDAEVAVLMTKLGDLTLLPRGSSWQWTTSAPSGSAWLNGATPNAATWLIGVQAGIADDIECSVWLRFKCHCAIYNTVESQHDLILVRDEFRGVNVEFGQHTISDYWC